MSSSTRPPRISRSRSPPTHRSSHHRTRSPPPAHELNPDHIHNHTHHHHKPHVSAPPPSELPFNARQITKRDLAAFKPMFALYLDIQKHGLVLEELEEKEVKGRWKSFCGKWNRGELSEGWYDPEMLGKAVESAKGMEGRMDLERRERGGDAVGREEKLGQGRVEEGSDSEDSIGPTLPGKEGRGRGRMGPSVPNMQDLELKREMDAEDGLARRDDIRYARKEDRKAQKTALDELVPRAEAGTRERQLEKKKEVNEKMKSFREKSPGAMEVHDSELMGGGDGVDEFKKTKKDFERKKNERELRKEEILRARLAEREERLGEYRKKEEGTMEMLRELAKQRFG